MALHLTILIVFSASVMVRGTHQIFVRGPSSILQPDLAPPRWYISRKRFIVRLLEILIY